MICGVDANVLIYASVESMPEHRQVYEFMQAHVIGGELTCALTFPVILEFIHITTDARRFKLPLSMEESIQIAEQYWTAADWLQLFPKATTGSRSFDLLSKHKLGRNRLLDTSFAATLLDNDVVSVITADAGDFAPFDELQIINPTLPWPPQAGKKR